MTPEQAWSQAREAGIHKDVYGRKWTRAEQLDMWLYQDPDDPQRGLWRGNGYMQQAIMFEAGDH